jgi:hypothetical protein
MIQSVTHRAFNAPANVRGELFHGKIHLVADSLMSREYLRVTVAHELMGRYGLASFFGVKLRYATRSFHFRYQCACNCAIAVFSRIQHWRVDSYSCWRWRSVCRLTVEPRSPIVAPLAHIVSRDWRPVSRRIDRHAIAVFLRLSVLPQFGR